MRIGTHDIGPDHRTFLIAEVGQAHDGSLGMAHAYIDAAADAGVDAVKFQTHIAAAESTLDEPFRVPFSRQDATRYAYWRRMEFTPGQWENLSEHAAKRGLVFLSSPFSVEAVALLDALNMAAWKIGSGETLSGDILDAVLATKKPLLLSTGMSTFGEIDALVKTLRTRNSSFALFQCTSKYPVSLSEIGLNVISEMKERYACPVGLSDHSGSLFPALAAMAVGADLIEAHIVFDKRLFGPDTPASLTVEDFSFLVRARDAFYAMHANPVDKDAAALTLEQMRTTFTKSLSVTHDLPAGTVLSATMLAVRKPGTGIPIGETKTIIGKKLKRDVSPTRLLQWEDLDD